MEHTICHINHNEVLEQNIYFFRCQISLPLSAVQLLFFNGKKEKSALYWTRISFTSLARAQWGRRWKNQLPFISLSRMFIKNYHWNSISSAPMSVKLVNKPVLHLLVVSLYQGGTATWFACCWELISFIGPALSALSSWILS